MSLTNVGNRVDESKRASIEIESSQCKQKKSETDAIRICKICKSSLYRSTASLIVKQIHGRNLKADLASQSSSLVTLTSDFKWTLPFNANRVAFRENIKKIDQFFSFLRQKCKSKSKLKRALNKVGTGQALMLGLYSNNEEECFNKLVYLSMLIAESFRLEPKIPESECKAGLLRRIDYLCDLYNQGEGRYKLMQKAGEEGQ